MYLSKLLFNCDEVHDVSTSDGVRGTKHTVFSLFAACFAQIIAGLCTIINFQSLKHIGPPYNTSGHISHKGGGGKRKLSGAQPLWGPKEASNAIIMFILI